MAQSYLLDSNAITGILKKDARVASRFQTALAANATIFMSPVVFYEIKRGLLKRDAHKQLGFFEQLTAMLQWDEIQRADWDNAAVLWANSTTRGRNPADADLLIAIHARRLNAVVVTANERDFAEFGIQVENWLAQTPG